MNDTISIILIFASAFVSGLLGVLVSTLYHKRSERRREKWLILKQLIGNRHDITGEAFTEALNSVFVVFYDSRDVKQALKEFHEVVVRPYRTQQEVNQKLLELFKAMCKNLKINVEPLTDNFFLEAYNIRRAT